MLDADDVCARDRLEKQVAAMQLNPQAVACFTGHWLFDEHGPITAYPADPAVGDLDSLTHLSRCLVVCASVLFDRRQAGGLRYPLGLRNCADMVFNALLRTRGRFVVLPEALYGYRRWLGQLTRHVTFLDGFEDRMNWLRANWRTYWPDNTLAQAEAVQWNGLVDLMTDHYWAHNQDKFLGLRATSGPTGRKRWPCGPNWRGVGIPTGSGKPRNGWIGCGRAVVFRNAVDGNAP